MSLNKNLAAIGPAIADIQLLVTSLFEQLVPGGLEKGDERDEWNEPTKNVNILDQVYDIIDELSRQSDNEDGWVDMAHITSMAGHKALTREMVQMAVGNWEGLSALLRNKDNSAAKLLY